MAGHTHKWEVLEDVYFPKRDEHDNVVSPTDRPHRVEYCGCGETQWRELEAHEAEALGIRLGVVDVLTNVSGHDASGS